MLTEETTLLGETTASNPDDAQKAMNKASDPNVGNQVATEASNQAGVPINAQKLSGPDLVTIQNCQGSWSKCNADCEKTFSIQIEANDLGKGCEATHGQTADCNVGEGACTSDSGETEIPHILASSHGDPIIRTFNGECYDLQKDGLYVASSHDSWNHVVKVAVYNNFIREIQITNKQGRILYSFSNLNEESGHWAYGLVHRVRVCNDFKWHECDFMHEQLEFDAQTFKYNSQILYHNYKDAALNDGERGVHLDIYPVLYDKQKKNFKAEEYTGIYFENPLPEELPYCSSQEI